MRINTSFLALFLSIFALTGCGQGPLVINVPGHAPDNPGDETPPCDPCDNPVEGGSDVDGDGIDDVDDQIIFCADELGQAVMGLSGFMAAGGTDLTWQLVGDPSPLTSGDWWNGSEALLWTDDQAFLVVVLPSGGYQRLTGLAYDEDGNAHWLQYAWVCANSDEPSCVLNEVWNDDTQQNEYSYALGGFFVSGGRLTYANGVSVELGSCPW